MKHIKWHQTMFILALAMGQAVAVEKAFDYVLPHIPGSAQPEKPKNLGDTTIKIIGITCSITERGKQEPAIGRPITNTQVCHTNQRLNVAQSVAFVALE